MKKAFFALLLLAGAAAMMATTAFADGSYNENPGIQLSNSKLMRQHPAGQGLGTSAAIYDTTWVGFSASNHVGPQNYWNLYVGVNRPGSGDPANAIWTFEDLTNAHGDSLMGWWPTNDRAGVLGASLTDDHLYAYSCMDFGNETSNINLGALAGSQRRSWGFPGAWHSDPGKNAVGGIGVTWTPISGNKTAWCGLREHGDNSVVDATTGNPFNQNAADFILQNSALSVKNFPGYVRAWDQMLYRDITPVTGQPLTLSFLYRTRMSLAFTAGAGRRGWFHGDPLTTSAGNFISSFTGGIIDSFQVYIGVPITDTDNAKLSTGASAPVYDTQRRWFSEVLRIWDAPYHEILTTFGTNPSLADTTGFNTFSAVIPWATLNPIVSDVNNSSGNVRLVFRVKTNNTGDDLTSSTWGELGGRGAAQIDDVTTQWGAGAATVIGAFEGLEGDAGNINNAIGTSPVTYWKATGKPPALYFHARPLAGLTWHDLCGAVGAGTRQCNMEGNVIDAGNDPTETIGDPNFEAGMNGYYGMMSPTINLSTTTSPNSQGITTAMAAASDDYYIQWDVYTGDFNYAATGVFYYFGCASFPNKSVGNKTIQWGDIVTSPSIYYNPDPQCYTDFLPFKAKNMIFTSSTSGAPDSLKLYMAVYNFPYRFGVTVGSNPTDGAYFDNISFALVNKAGGTGNVGTISSDIWQWFNDAFPVGGPALGTGTTVAALDTCGALIKGALNNAQLSASANLGGQRLSILADSIVTTASDVTVAVGDTNSKSIRVDMIFRILPGPGNYRSQVGDVARTYPLSVGMALLRSPADRVTLMDPTNGADHSFWADYIRNPGQFASGSHPLNGITGKKEWSNVVWNSARMDTLETNQFPTQNITTAFPVRAGYWQSTLHDAELIARPNLGISRPRCFVIDTTAFTNLGSNNEICGSAPVWLTTVPQSRTGWDGTVTTTEGTKIIPDGLLTPGSHVQYFFRKSQIFQVGGYAMDPDTQTISPQQSEGNFDGHRWQQISILPDRWKDVAFGGAGMACMLYADYNDRRGDELVWVSVMDSIGGTAASKWGSHNGWHAAAGTRLNGNSNPNLQAQAFVYKNAQPGTLWDMYGVRASESGNSVGVRIGGRLGLLGTDLLAGHDAQVAPTPDMLKQYYTAIALLTGDLNSEDLGPNPDMPEDDLALLTDFLTSGSGLTSKPRGLFVAGNGFAESEAFDPTHASWMATQLGMSLVNPSYSALSSNPKGCSDLTSTAVISSSDIYGVGLSCFYTDDVIAYNPAKLGAQNVSFYENTGAGPYAASVYHARTPSNDPENFVSLVDGFDYANLWGRYCATSYGRLAYTYNVMTKVFSTVCGAWTSPSGVLDVPQAGHGGQFANFMKVGNSVMRSGNATVRFGVANTGRVRVRLYDVTGRLVRTLADKTYQGGQEYSAMWDGRGDSGDQVARGVYFARIDYATGAAINGRVVVLQ